MHCNSSSAGHQEDVWRLGQATVAAANPYSLVFEAEIGSNAVGDIAIDDVDILEDRKCPRPGKVMDMDKWLG